MKKVWAWLIVSVLIFSLTACNEPAENEPAPSSSDNAAVESQKDEASEVTGAPADEPQDDAATVEALKARLLGEWKYPETGSDMERLTFGADGTGTYRGLNDRDLTFTYDVYVDHRTYANGAPYDENILKVNYSTGETEEINFFFNDNGQMAFHSFEGGGYTGMMYALDVFTKE